MSETLVSDPIRLVIDRYTQDAPVRVEAIARDLGIPVRVDAEMPDQVAGKIVKESVGAPAGYVIYVRGADVPRRQRFTLAHELGHYVLHRDLIGDGLIDDAMYRSKLGDSYERQANRFAADLLMPAAIVRGLYRGGARSMADLGRILDVSEPAIRIRLQELGLGP